jgi:ubiquinone biosynthesis protein
MKRSIASIPQLYRNVRRWTEIVSVLSRYGLANWLSRFKIEFMAGLLKGDGGEILSDLTQNERIRLALTDLGPTFIKFGQLLSTRPDVVGTELAEELAKLQSDTPADDFEVVKATIEAEQGRPLEEIFTTFDPTPIASASIGQVHLATLTAEFRNKEQPKHDSGSVVVKVRHEGIERTVETDLDILAGLAQLAEGIEDFRSYQPVAVVNEMSRTMRRELDLDREANNLLQFRSMFANEKTLTVPQPIMELCSPRMIAMDRINGTKLKHVATSEHLSPQAAQLARDGANAYLKMIFHHGFYHADPHPGNLLVTDDGKLGLLDFGMVGRISEQLREDIEAMLVAIVHQDVPMLTTLIRRVGNCPMDLDSASLSNEVADFVGQYSTQAMSSFDMSGALVDFISLVRRYQITLPNEASLLIKVLITLEGTGRLLTPDFSLMEIMKPFQRMLVVKRLSPARHLRKMRRFYMEVEQLTDELPRKLGNILEQVQSGSFDVHLVHRRLGPTANRLVLGMLASAIFMGSSLMLSYKVPPLICPGGGPLGIQDLSVLGLAGFFVSLTMGLRLMWAIRKSGNLDQPE